MEDFNRIEDVNTITQLNSLQNGGHLICKVCKREHVQCEYAPAYGMILCPSCRWGETGKTQGKE